MVSRGLAGEDRNLHGAASMSKQPLFTLVGAALALTVLGCRNDDRSNRPDDTSRGAMPAPTDTSPPLIEDDDEIGEHDDDADDADGSLREVPRSGDDEVRPVDPDMPESVDPGDPKQPPPPSRS